MTKAEKEIVLDDTRKLVCTKRGTECTFSVHVLNTSSNIYEPDKNANGSIKPALVFHQFGSIADFDALLRYIGHCDCVGKLCTDLANFGQK